MANAAELYALQKIDSTWDKVRRRLIQLQKLMGESAELQAARAAVESTTAQLHEWQAKQKDAELQSQSLQKKIAETERALMSGEIHNPKELETLQASLEALQRQRAGVDDGGVEAMMQVDELAKTLEEQTAVLRDVEAAWRSSQGTLADEELRMKRNYLALKKKRSELVGELDADLVKKYEDLRKRKAGVAIAAIEQGSCSACNVQIPTGVISSARSQRDVYCPSCGRLLYAG